MIASHSLAKGYTISVNMFVYQAIRDLKPDCFVFFKVKKDNIGVVGTYNVSLKEKPYPGYNKYTREDFTEGNFNFPSMEVKVNGIKIESFFKQLPEGFIVSLSKGDYDFLYKQGEQNHREQQGVCCRFNDEEKEDIEIKLENIGKVTDHSVSLLYRIKPGIYSSDSDVFKNAKFY